MDKRSGRKGVKSLYATGGRSHPLFGGEEMEKYMAEGRGPKDDVLIQELYDKLSWFTFQASDEEFDAEQVGAMLKLLDKLDPIDGKERFSEKDREAARARREGQNAPAQGTDGRDTDALEGNRSRQNESETEYDPSDPVAAFARFRKRYSISDEALAEKEKEAGKIVDFHRNRTEFSDELAPNGQEVARRLSQAEADDEDFPEAAAAIEAMGMAAGAETDYIQYGEGAKDGTKKGRRMGKLARLASGIAITVAAFTVLNIGTNAVAQKSFFEIVRDSANGMKITITGNEVESETGGWIADDNEKTYYDSWDELEQALNVRVLKPGYLPEGAELEELYSQELNNGYWCVGSYGDLRIEIVIFSNDYAKIDTRGDPAWKILEENDDRILYDAGKYKILEWLFGRGSYSIWWFDTEEMIKIYDDMLK